MLIVVEKQEKQNITYKTDYNVQVFGKRKAWFEQFFNSRTTTRTNDIKRTTTNELNNFLIK